MGHKQSGRGVCAGFMSHLACFKNLAICPLLSASAKTLSADFIHLAKNLTLCWMLVSMILLISTIQFLQEETDLLIISTTDWLSQNIMTLLFSNLGTQRTMPITTANNSKYSILGFILEMKCGFHISATHSFPKTHPNPLFAPHHAIKNKKFDLVNYQCYITAM